jgi:hypothetical protein
VREGAGLTAPPIPPSPPVSTSESLPKASLL